MCNVHALCDCPNLSSSSAEQFFYEKNLAIDLLASGVTPGYLIDSGFIAEAVYDAHLARQEQKITPTMDQMRQVIETSERKYRTELLAYFTAKYSSSATVFSHCPNSFGLRKRMPVTAPIPLPVRVVSSGSNASPSAAFRIAQQGNMAVLPKDYALASKLASLTLVNLSTDLSESSPTDNPISAISPSPTSGLRMTSLQNSLVDNSNAGSPLVFSPAIASLSPRPATMMEESLTPTQSANKATPALDGLPSQTTSVSPSHIVSDQNRDYRYIGACVDVFVDSITQASCHTDSGISATRLLDKDEGANLRSAQGRAGTVTEVVSAEKRLAAPQHLGDGAAGRPIAGRERFYTHADLIILEAQLQSLKQEIHRVSGVSARPVKPQIAVIGCERVQHGRESRRMEIYRKAVNGKSRTQNLLSTGSGGSSRNKAWRAEVPGTS